MWHTDRFCITTCQKFDTYSVCQNVSGFNTPVAAFTVRRAAHQADKSNLGASRVHNDPGYPYNPVQESEVFSKHVVYL